MGNQQEPSGDAPDILKELRAHVLQTAASRDALKEDLWEVKGTLDEQVAELEAALARDCIRRDSRFGIYSYPRRKVLCWELGPDAQLEIRISPAEGREERGAKKGLTRDGTGGGSQRWTPESSPSR